MHIGDHATRCSEKDLLKAKAIIGANADWIEYHPVLPNTQVLDLMKKSHVGLLPTWADTYGFVVLEYQSCGCPVITTDVRALPEINNQDIGWLIEVPKDEWGEAYYQTADQRAGLREAILRQLDTVVKSLYVDRQGIRARAARAIEHVRENHSPQAYAHRMKAVYGEALGVSIQ